MGKVQKVNQKVNLLTHEEPCGVPRGVESHNSLK